MMRTPSTNSRHRGQIPFEKEWNTSRSPASDVSMNLGSRMGSCMILSFLRGYGTRELHSLQHFRIGEARVLFAVEDVVRARRDVRSIRGRDADAALHHP